MYIAMDISGTLYVMVRKSNRIIGWERLPLHTSSPPLKYPAFDLPVYCDPPDWAIDYYRADPATVANTVLTGEAQDMFLDTYRVE